MLHNIILLGMLLGVLLFAYGYSWRKQVKRRHELFLQQISREALIELHKIPFYRQLPHAERRLLRGRLAVLLDEKQLEGCGGLVITLEMKVMIYAAAALLLLKDSWGYYPGFHSVLLYPDAYRVVGNPLQSLSGSVVVEEITSGTTSRQGNIVLSWAKVREEGLAASGSSLAVLREFARQIDWMSRHVSGNSFFHDSKDDRRKLREKIDLEFRRLRLDGNSNRRVVIDFYGADDPEDFFAIASEAFFCRPVLLREVCPELYALYCQFYQLDPARF